LASSTQPASWWTRAAASDSQKAAASRSRKGEREGNVGAASWAGHVTRGRRPASIHPSAGPGQPRRESPCRPGPAPHPRTAPTAHWILLPFLFATDVIRAVACSVPHPATPGTRSDGWTDNCRARLRSAVTQTQLAFTGTASHASSHAATQGARALKSSASPSGPALQVLLQHAWCLVQCGAAKSYHRLLALK